MIRIRRLLAGAMTIGGAVVLVFPALAIAQDNAPRTDTDLLGFDLDASAAPVSVRIYEDFIPLPVPPGKPQFEFTFSHTGSTLTGGPSSRAQAASIWPGPGLGDGWGTVVCSSGGEDCDDSQPYPISATAKYPGAGEDDWETQTTFPGVEGFGMYATARGLDAVARSEGGGAPSAMDALIRVGNVRSRSETTVLEGQAIGRSLSEASSVAILGGVLVLENVSTMVEGVSDGETSSTSGTTTVGGITLMGMPLKLTDKGFVVEPPSDGEDDDGGAPGLGGLLDPANRLIQQLTTDLVGDGFEEALGIQIEALQHREEVDGPIAERIAEGVRIRIDLQTAASYLAPIVDLLPVADVLGQVPPEFGDLTSQLTGLFYEFRGLTPGIEIVLGGAVVDASASPPFQMPELPPLPAPPAFEPPTTTGTTTTTPTTSSDGFSVPPTTGFGGGTALPPTTVAPPSPVAPPVVAIGAEMPEPFGGIPAILVGAALLFGAIPTFGLRNLRELAVGATAAANGTQPLPDLRGGA
jgi:hypothetical protein